MRALLLITFTAAGLFAQADNWNLLRGIHVGQTVHVHMLDGHLNRGGFLSTSDTNIVIRRRAGDMTFTKDQIRKVSVRKAGKRWRNAAIGAGIGAAASVGVTMNTGGSDDVVRLFVFVAAVSAMVGTGIGALVPGYDTLYRAPRK